ncbi:methylated-DNA--[protein]-cysteine S-methyltransferase [soil metagenome]
MTAVTVHTQPSPLGELLVATTPEGVCLVDWGDHDVAARRLADRFGGPVRYSRSRSIAGRDLDSFFAGKLRSFTVPLDLTGVSAFLRRVLERLAAVPFGELTTYGSLARAVRSAPRAVGQAVGSNPVPVRVPCHRVIAADGTLGGFGGGLERKRILLALEGHEPLSGGWALRRGVAPPLARVR